MNRLPMLTVKQGEKAECRVIGLGKAAGPDAAPNPLHAATFSRLVLVPSTDVGGKWLRRPKKICGFNLFVCLFVFSPPFCFWDVKANVNPCNRNYSKEIHIRYSEALHPNSFKIFH